MVTTLSQLPTEVTSSILSALPHESLVALTKTSKFLRELATRLLLRSVLIAATHSGEDSRDVKPPARIARLTKPMDRLESIPGAVEYVREVTIGLPDYEVDFTDWNGGETESKNYNVLSDEIIDRLCTLLRRMSNLQSCSVTFDYDFDSFTAYKIMSSLNNATSLRKFHIGFTGSSVTKCEEFTEATGGKPFPFPAGLTELKIDLALEPSYHFSEDPEETMLGIIARSLILPSVKTLTRLFLKVSNNIDEGNSGEEDSEEEGSGEESPGEDGPEKKGSERKHLEFDLEELAGAPLTYLNFTERKEKEENDNVPKICKLFPDLEELRLEEYWGDRELFRFRKEIIDSLKSLKKLRKIHFGYDFEKDAGDLQDDIYDGDDADPYEEWEKRVTQRRLEASKPLAEALGQLRRIEWFYILDDGNERYDAFNVIRDVEGNFVELQKRREFWGGESENDETDNEEDEEEQEEGDDDGDGDEAGDENGDEGDDGEGVDDEDGVEEEEAVEQSASEAVFSGGEAEDAEGEDADDENA